MAPPPLPKRNAAAPGGPSPSEREPSSKAESRVVTRTPSGASTRPARDARTQSERRGAHPAPVEPALELAPGVVVGAKYRLERLLKAGGMGAVWVATHLTLDTLVAIKFMSTPVDEAGASPKEGHAPPDGGIPRARFEREAKTAAQLRSANVVQILDYGVDRGAAYIVMELLDGQDLEQRVRQGRIPLDETAKIIVPVLHLLQRAHDAGMIHRDLKPANIFLARDGDAEVPKVLDFGVAKPVQKAASSEGDLTADRTLIGTPHYASPEQLMCSQQIDHRADLWSMGVVVFRMLTGKKPFRSGLVLETIVEVCSAPIPKPTSAAPDLPPEVDAFFERALQRDLDRRFQSAREMAQALSGLV